MGRTHGPRPDARTGKQTWSYYRSDRTVCTAAQIGGVAVAVYRLAGNCDELTGLDADTGARVWTRTLDSNGQPVDGLPAFQADAADQALLITTPSTVYSVTVARHLARPTARTTSSTATSGAASTARCWDPPAP